MIDHTRAKEYLKSLTLLLVENEAFTQRMLREFLQRLVAVVIAPWMHVVRLLEAIE